MNDMERLMAQLDKNHPMWAVDWADQFDLQDLVKGTASQKVVRVRIARRLHIAINAAVEAGIVCLPQE